YLKIKKTDHITWAKDGKATLVEYSDLQCPACKTFHEILKKLEATDSAYPEIVKNIKLVYRHFPLTSIHKNALKAAFAAEAAGEQGKFFEMVDLLFETQEQWSDLDNPTDHFVNLAQKLKLNIEKFKKDINSEKIKQKVYSDMRSGEKLKIFGTPTFFLNGKKLEFKTPQEFIEKLKAASVN
ncbi:MAG TPA: hypothetical protein EYP10_08645, partial [Armatimonadetes bacterium]|nr:hypothetical protein [Armatimonadota bacterium]